MPEMTREADAAEIASGLADVLSYVVGSSRADLFMQVQGLLNYGWYDPSATFEIDFENGLYALGGANYSAGAWRVAAGAVENATGIVLGPVVRPEAPERLLNGTFDTNIDDWTIGQAGGSPSITYSSGKLHFDGNGSNTPKVYQVPSTVQGRAYQFKGEVTRTSGSHTLLAGASSDLTSTVANTAISINGLNEFELFWTADAATMSVGEVYQSSTATGVAELDNLSVKEVVPVADFTPGNGITFKVEATAPVGGSGVMTVIDVGDAAIINGVAASRNYGRLNWDAATEAVVLVVRSANVEVANLTLGTVAAGQDFAAICSLYTNAFQAAFIGGPVRVDAGGNLPGIAAVRIGQPHSGTAFDTDNLKHIWFWDAALSTDAFLSAAADAFSAVAWGDSLTNGAGSSDTAHRYPQVQETLSTPMRSVVNRGVNGETSTQIKARLLAAPLLKDRAQQLWMGRNNASDPTTVKADIAACIAFCGHARYLVGGILPSATDNAGALAGIVQLNADLLALYGSKFVNLLTPLQAANDGSANDLADVAAGLVPRSLRADEIHLNDVGYTIVAAVWLAARQANGF